VLTDEVDRYEFTTWGVFKDVNEWKNRLSSKTGTNKDDATYSYDANGNLTAEVVDIVRASTTTERRHFTYDAFNRLISVHSDVAKTTLISEYRYNGLGQRTRWRYMSRERCIVVAAQ
jgi:YD repeat-containing protein